MEVLPVAARNSQLWKQAVHAAPRRRTFARSPSRRRPARRAIQGRNMRDMGAVGPQLQWRPPELAWRCSQIIPGRTISPFEQQRHPDDPRWWKRDALGCHGASSDSSPSTRPWANLRAVHCDRRASCLESGSDPRRSTSTLSAHVAVQRTVRLERY